MASNERATLEIIEDIDWEMAKKDFKFFFEEILGWQLADHHAKWFHNLSTHNRYCVKAS